MKLSVLIKLLQFFIPLKPNRQLQNLTIFFIFKKSGSVNPELFEDFFLSHCFIMVGELFLLFHLCIFNRYKCKVKEDRF